MYLERIDIQGFKSFAQPVSLLFNKELTAIVGPNGSGKSNIADAIRWVLGEQSMKLLRGKKSDDVIFGGSSLKGRLGYARVAIHLNNSNHQADIDYDEVVIERIVQRSGESEYKLNGRKVRLSDVQLLLAKARVGQKSYSVIGQGMIDSMLTLSAQERRDFFDEATGVRQYQIKKHQAVIKLEHTEENLKQAELVLQELAPRLRTLTRQVKRLERKEEIEKQLHAVQSEYYGYLTQRLMSELTALSDKKTKTETLCNDLLQKQKNIQSKLDEYEHSRDRSSNYDTLQKKLFNTQQEFNALTKKKIIIEGQKDIDLIKSGGGHQVMIKQLLEDLRSKRSSLLLNKEELTHSLEQRNILVKKIDQQSNETHKKLKSIEHELSHGEKKIDWSNLESEAKKLHADHALLLDHFNAVTSTDHINSFRQKLQAFAERLKEFLGRIQKQRHAEGKELWKQFSEISLEYEGLQTRLHVEQTQSELERQKIEAIKGQAAELEREITALEKKTSVKGTSHSQTTAGDLETLEIELSKKQEEMKGIRNEIDSFNVNEEQKKRDLVLLQKDFRTIQYDLTIKNNELTNLKIEVAKLETRKEDLDKEINNEAPNVSLKPVTSLNLDQARDQIEQQKRQLNIIGGIDTETVREYEEVKEKHDYLEKQTTDLRKAQKTLVELIQDLDQQISKQFQLGFKNINVLFTKHFKKLFDGGSAKLILNLNEPSSEEEPDDEISSEEETLSHTIDKKLDYTIEIQATPPGKKLSSINVLSGGEKAMTSIALICSIIANNPPPFTVLDEVDAALDEANSIRFIEIVSELSHKTQFITVTHNRATMHQAKILYGVTMGEDGISRLLSVNFDQADKLSS